MVPSLSYAIPAFRTVEDIVPDNDIDSSNEVTPVEILKNESKEAIPRPATDD